MTYALLQSDWGVNALTLNNTTRLNERDVIEWMFWRYSIPSLVTTHDLIQIPGEDNAKFKTYLENSFEGNVAIKNLLKKATVNTMEIAKLPFIKTNVISPIAGSTNPPGTKIWWVDVFVRTPDEIVYYTDVSRSNAPTTNINPSFSLSL